MNTVEFRIDQVVLPYFDADASLAFYRDALGFEVRSVTGKGAMRRLTIGPVNQPELSVVLAPLTSPTGTPQYSELIDAGAFPSICVSTSNLLGTFAQLEASTAVAEVIQEPIRQQSGEYDCVFFDPAGNVVRVVEDRGHRPTAATQQTAKDLECAVVIGSARVIRRWLVGCGVAAFRAFSRSRSSGPADASG